MIEFIWNGNGLKLGLICKWVCKWAAFPLRRVPAALIYFLSFLLLLFWRAFFFFTLVVNRRLIWFDWAALPVRHKSATNEPRIQSRPESLLRAARLIHARIPAGWHVDKQTNVDCLSPNQNFQVPTLAARVPPTSTFYHHFFYRAKYQFKILKLWQMVHQYLINIGYF